MTSGTRRRVQRPGRLRIPAPRAAKDGDFAGRLTIHQRRDRAVTLLTSPYVRLGRQSGRRPLYLDEPREPLGLHQADVSVVWDLAPRLLDPPPLLARRDADARDGASGGCVIPTLAPSKLRRTTVVGSISSADAPRRLPRSASRSSESSTLWTPRSTPTGAGSPSRLRRRSSADRYPLLHRRAYRRCPQGRSSARTPVDRC